MTSNTTTTGSVKTHTVIIVGGVLSGIFTVTESGAFGTLYAFAITLIVYRSLSWTAFKTAVLNSVRTPSMVLILVASATAFAYMLTFYQVPTRMIEFMTGLTDPDLHTDFFAGCDLAWYGSGAVRHDPDDESGSGAMHAASRCMSVSWMCGRKSPHRTRGANDLAILRSHSRRADADDFYPRHFANIAAAY